MLENLTSSLGRIINNVMGKYRLNDSNIKDILKKFRKSLLEADVSWSVVKSVIASIRDKLIGMEISRKISPGNMFLKVVNDEFINILGGKDLNVKYSLVKNKELHIVLLVGLQGVGKTTSVVKLAKWIEKKDKKSVLVVGCDLFRPAAIKQLEILSKKALVECFCDYKLTDSLEFIINKAVSFAKSNKYDFLIIDSAGRLHVDEFMMSEIRSICKMVTLSDTFLVIDGMVGQDVLNSVTIFCKNVNVTGFILTKMDGDARGGVLLSLSYVMKKPIRFLGMGENIDDLEHFKPDRIVSRILGRGDISGLLEIVNDKLDKTESEELSKKIFENVWDLSDFKLQLKQMMRVGGVKGVLDKLPGMQSFNEIIKNKIDDKYFICMIAVIDSMTPKERKFPGLMNGSRKRRIAGGSGTDIQGVNKLLKQYSKMKMMLTKYSGKKNVSSMLKEKLSFLKK